MVRSDSCGQRSLALARSRCRNEVLVDSGSVGTVSMMLVPMPGVPLSAPTGAGRQTMDGYVEFRNATGNRGTFVSANIIYSPPGGRFGAALAKLLGKHPGFLMRQDLRRFKALIEAGEIPTIEGQSHGPRSRVAGAARVLDPDQSVRRESRLADVLEAKRRTA